MGFKCTANICWTFQSDYTNTKTAKLEPTKLTPLFALIAKTNFNYYVMYAYAIFVKLQLCFSYAMPMFVRVQTEMSVTSTFKQLKGQLVKEGFDPALISDKLYYEDSPKKKYIPLSIDLYNTILAGKSKL